MNYLSWLWPKIAQAANEFCDSAGNPVNNPDINNPRVNTAFGCVPVEIKAFVEWFLPYLLGIAGGISFLLMVYGFVLWATSEGDAKKVAGAQETVTSAVTGLLVCIFGLFILRLVAVDILQIPGITK